MVCQKRYTCVVCKEKVSTVVVINSAHTYCTECLRKLMDVAELDILGYED